MESDKKDELPRTAEEIQINNAEMMADEIVEKAQEFPKFEQIEAMLLEKALQRSNGNVSKAATMLGLTRPQFAYRLKKINNTTAFK